MTLGAFIASSQCQPSKEASKSNLSQELARYGPMDKIQLARAQQSGNFTTIMATIHELLVIVVPGVVVVHHVEVKFGIGVGVNVRILCSVPEVGEATG